MSVLLLSSTNTLESIEVVKGEIRVHFDEPYNKSIVKHFALTRPYREVFDIAKTRIQDKSIGKNLSSPHFRSVRVSQYKKNVVRVVIDIGKSYVCTPYKPLFSTLDYHIPLPKFVVNKEAGKKIEAAKPIKSSVLQTNHKTPVAITAPKNRKPIVHHHPKELVVIDAGHGGHDSGAIGGGKREKDLVLQISKRLEQQLKKRGYRVYMTRRSDRFLKLPQRTRIADKKGAKVFISIHANSVPKRLRKRVSGVETFFLQTTRDAKSQRIAARENKAVLKGAGSKLSKKVIVDSVLNGPKIVQSNKLAIDVQRSVVSRLRSKYSGVKNGGVRPAPFWVLVGASRPSILVEVGYISNPRERRRLFNGDYQNKIAEGIANGVNSYLVNRKKEIDF